MCGGVCGWKCSLLLFSQVRIIIVFHFLVDVMQFFPFYSVMAVRFPDESIDGELKVVKCILEDVSNSVDREGSIKGSEMHNGFRDNSIENPRDREQGKTILQIVKPRGPVCT